MTDTDGNSIEARLVADENRLGALPRHFRGLMLVVEDAVYAMMRQLSASYRGGYWEYFELSNGGFYMRLATKDRIQIQVYSNGYEGEMSADAAGIVVCLMVFSHLSFKYEALADYFHALRDFAKSHPEASAIFSAVD